MKVKENLLEVLVRECIREFLDEKLFGSNPSPASSGKTPPTAAEVLELLMNLKPGQTIENNNGRWNNFSYQAR